MLRRPTRLPETLLRARESPAGAGPSWCSRTSLVAQTAGHASVAEVAHEAVARARLIPEDVRLVAPKVVAGDGVVPGFRRSAEERIRRDHDPARDRGGARGDVARDLISRNLHATRAYPVLADYYVLSVNSPHNDSVARIGSVYGLLDGLARPNDLVCRLRRADRRRQCHPACHQHGQSHGGQQHYGASHKETAFRKGAG